ncbi:MAG: hypothetical protein IPM35_13415, partial [Myxococcales bacterium]|nr:hypothetical protein [Myxococcales bacterium]
MTETRERLGRLLRSESASLVVVGLAFGPLCYRALLERWSATGQATFPGHADSAFYFSLAKNIASGRG